MDMTLSFIIAVALSTVLMLIIIGLVVALAYYRWAHHRTDVRHHRIYI